MWFAVTVIRAGNVVSMKSLSTATKSVITSYSIHYTKLYESCPGTLSIDVVGPCVVTSGQSVF